MTARGTKAKVWGALLNKLATSGQWDRTGYRQRKVGGGDGDGQVAMDWSADRRPCELGGLTH